MDPFASGKVHGAVSLVAVDVIGRLFGCGRQRRSRFKSQGYSKVPDRSGHATRRCFKLTSIRNLVQTRYDSSDEEDELTVLHRQLPRSSCSSDDSSKRWTSSTDQYSPRRRKGYYCMRLRIVNMVRIVAMLRKIRLAYRRMTKAAAASKTILCLGDLYNNIADLIPVSCSGNNAGNNDAHIIVVIRPAKCESGPSQDDGEEIKRLAYDEGITARPPLPTAHSSLVLRPSVAHDTMLASGLSQAVATGDTPSSSWRKFAFRTFSCIATSSVTDELQ